MMTNSLSLPNCYSKSIKVFQYAVTSAVIEKSLWGMETLCYRFRVGRSLVWPRGSWGPGWKELAGAGCALRLVALQRLRKDDGAGCRWVREAATDGTEKGERLNITEKKWKVHSFRVTFLMINLLYRVIWLELTTGLPLIVTWLDVSLKRILLFRSYF